MRDDTGEPQAGPHYESAPELKLEVRVRTRSSMGWRRPAARLIDIALLAAPVVWVFWALRGTTPANSVDDYRLMFQILAAIASFVWFVVGWPIYEALAVAISGRTFGKWITGLCVVDADAGRIRVGSLLGRTLLVVGSFVVTFFIALRLWGVYPPLAILPAAALVLSQAIPALLGQRTWLDIATGTDVVRWGRLTSGPSAALRTANASRGTPISRA
jgi:uncharacterized RDD family membrane protein YckC